MTRVSTRPARLTDLFRLYRWRNLAYITKLSSSKRTVSLFQHTCWFLFALSRTFHHIYVVNYHPDSHAVPIGQVRFSQSSLENDHYVISMYLLSPYSGKGLGKEAFHHSLTHFLNHLYTNGATKAITLIAIIRSDNTRSLSFFSRLGFSPVSHPYPSDFIHLSKTSQVTADE